MWICECMYEYTHHGPELLIGRQVTVEVKSLVVGWIQCLLHMFTLLHIAVKFDSQERVA